MNFYDSIERFGCAIALIDDGGSSVSYSELAHRADSISNFCNTRSLVFCLCENSTASVTGYIGFLRARVVPLLLPKGINPHLLQRLISIYEPGFLWLPSTFVGIKELGQTIFCQDRYILIKTNYEVSHHLHDSLAQLLTTSGSTGSPKLVRQSYTNIDSNSSAIADYLQITNTEKPITTLPMNYSYGLSILNSHLLLGCSILLTEKSLMDKKFWEFLNSENATSFGGVPYFYQILKRLGFDKLSFPSSFRAMTQAGGKLSTELTQELAIQCQRKNINFIVMYGQTEATARISWLKPEFCIQKLGSIGTSIPGGSLALLDETGTEIDRPNTVGELIYSGPNVCLGYANSYEDLSLGDVNQGKLRTGDLAKRDEDGFYFIVGRNRRILKIFGNRVSLDELEQVVSELGIECACTGIDDKCKIYTTSQLSDKEIKAHILERSGLNSSAFEVRRVVLIPRNEAGKIIYAELE